MSVIWTSEIDNILSIGICLSDEGINNWALTKEQSLLVVEKLFELKIPILGGEIYEKINGYIQPNGNGWFVSKVLNEPENDLINRSYKKAKMYINNYNLNSTFYIGFVPALRSL